MKEIKIKHLSYLLKQAKEKNKPQPIFFLGAGASRSGNIPLAGEIINKILEDYPDSPCIEELPAEKRTYANLMNCLLPNQRDELLKKYIDEAKINVTHIYLAQLISEGFVDYVLTVNFDNLVLRALALYNIFPSTYDMAILKDLTTTTFKEKSVVYLHGQHHGPWLLNTSEEMEKVRNTVPRIFDTIKNQRPWVFIGYSGEDPIFDHVKNLGRFDNGLYWVTYNDSYPSEKIQSFLSHSNINTFIIKGYDSDSFMLKLNSELGLEQPIIVDKPFSALKDMLNEIVDIDDQLHFKGVKERLTISKNQVRGAIRQFEKGEVDTRDTFDNKVDVLKKEIINLLISEKYDENVILEIENKIKENPDKEAESLLAGLYSDWGISLGDLAETKDGTEAEELYQQSFDKFRKATEIKPDKHEAYNNWGTYLGNLAKTKEGTEAEELFQQSFDKYRKATEIKPDDHEAYNNWGNYLGNLAETKEGTEAEELYNQSFDKFRKATEIKPDKHEAYFNWGTNLGYLAKIKDGTEAEKLYNQSFDKFRKATEIKPDKHEAYYNWGTYLGNLAKTKDGTEAEELYQQSFDKFRRAIEIKPGDHNAFNNWGTYLGYLAKTKDGTEGEELYQQSFDKFRKATEIKPDDHEAYNNWGNYLGNLAKTKDGTEAEELYQQSFDKFRKATEIKPDKHEAYYNWGTYLGNLAKTKDGTEAEEMYQQSFDKFHKSIQFGGSCYNLACIYAHRKNEEQALHYLNLSLSRQEITVNFVETDLDWKDFLGTEKFIQLLEKYKLNSTKV